MYSRVKRLRHLGFSGTAIFLSEARFRPHAAISFDGFLRRLAFCLLVHDTLSFIVCFLDFVLVVGSCLAGFDDSVAPCIMGSDDFSEPFQDIGNSVPDTFDLLQSNRRSRHRDWEGCHGEQESSLLMLRFGGDS
jgi:hypothetical protein